MRTILVLDLIPLKLVAGNLGYQYVMRYCIEGSCQVDGHRHCTVRWFPLVEACLGARAKLEERRCSQVAGSKSVFIFSW